jgi:hypothetical protein
MSFEPEERRGKQALRASHSASRAPTLFLLLVVGACQTSAASESPPSEAGPIAPTAVDAGCAAPPPRILDVFFGLDGALPPAASLLCVGGSGMDGMPVTLSSRIAQDAPDPTAFRVTTRSGQVHTPRCATLRPALGPTKRNTVLLIGELGSDPDDPPVRLDVVASVPLLNGGDALGLSAASVTPLSDGPSLRIAHRYAPTELSSSSCPLPETKQIVQVTWGGGVTAKSGDDLGDTERVRMHVTLTDGAIVTPVALADLGDRDNYTQLCLDTEIPATSVSVEAGVAVDPRGDPNPLTAVNVTPDCF